MDTEGLGELASPLIIAAFEGWNDAGDAASGAVAFLRDRLSAEYVGEIDPEDYYDFQAVRPQIRIDERGVRELTWPTTKVYVARGPRDLVLIQGIEPSMRWRSFSTELLGLALDLGAEEIVCLGALLADTPHTRPVPITGTASLASTAAKLGLEPNDYEGPTGIVGVLMDHFARSGIAAATVWAAVPHYVAAPPNPKATLALLNMIEPLVGRELDLADLAEEAAAWQTGVDEFASEDEEIAEYVSQLEEARDTADLPEASGDAIAAEFEKYLRHGDE